MRKFIILFSIIALFGLTLTGCSVAANEEIANESISKATVLPPLQTLEGTLTNIYPGVRMTVILIDKKYGFSVEPNAEITYMGKKATLENLLGKIVTVSYDKQKIAYKITASIIVSAK